MTEPQRQDAVERVAFYLFRKMVPHLADPKAQQTWEWAAPAQRQQYVEEAKEIVRLVEQA